MKIRRFFAPDIRQAMRLVREAQGPNAVILSNRNVDDGVEIVAAIDFDEILDDPETVQDAAPETMQNTTPSAPLSAPSARAAAQLNMFRAVAQTANAENLSKTESSSRAELAENFKNGSNPKLNNPINSGNAPKSALENSKPTLKVNPPPKPAIAQATNQGKSANISSPTNAAATTRIPAYNPPEARIPKGSTWQEDVVNLQQNPASKVSDNVARSTVAVNNKENLRAPEVNQPSTKPANIPNTSAAQTAKTTTPAPAKSAKVSSPANSTTTTSRIPTYNPPEARIPKGSTWYSDAVEQQETPSNEAINHNIRTAASNKANAVDHANDNQQTSSTTTHTRKVQWVPDPVMVDMRRELKELRGLLEHQLSGLAWSETTRRTPIQAQLLRAFTELGLTTNLARELAGAVSTMNEFDGAWRHAMGLLAERLTVEEDIILEQGGIVALVGATGVGKTTTVAKLAAHYALRHGRERVALVTTDSYRIGSQEQLRTFARILGVPMRVAADATELTQILEGLADCGLVLIDTAGMSQRDLRLSEQFATLKGAAQGIKSYLVLSAITQRIGLEEIIRAFSQINISGCILTKLDEAASLGEIISVLIRHKLAVTYLGVGQRVPEDLLPARAHNIVSRAVALLQNYLPDVEDEALAMAFGKS